MELADTLVADFDVVELLTLVTDRCVELLDVGAAGIVLVAPDGDLRVMASSSEAMRVLELEAHVVNDQPNHTRRHNLRLEHVARAAIDRTLAPSTLDRPPAANP